MTPTPPMLILGEIAAKLTPMQQQLLFKANALQWNEETWDLHEEERELVADLRRMGLFADMSGRLTQLGLQIVGYLTLERLRQDP